MENLSNPFNGILRRHWRRRQYRRLKSTIPIRKKKRKISKLGGTSRGFWRIKTVPKLHLKIASPSKLWSKIKNAYVNMMLNLAGNVSSLNNGDGFGGAATLKPHRDVQVASSKEEFDNRLVFEIFKSLMASKELAGATMIA